MFGIEGEYCWADHLGSAWKVLPKLIVGRRAVVTALDSSPPGIGPDEAARGWTALGEAVLISIVASVDEALDLVPDEYGEVWIYDADDPAPDFANWEPVAGEEMRITLASPSDVFPDSGDQTHDEGAAARRAYLGAVQARLRVGLSSLRPRTVVCQAFIATRDPFGVAELTKLRDAAATCACASRGEYAWAAPDVATFTAPFVRIAQEGWLGLYRCASCAAHWVVEHPDSHDVQSGVAVRVSDSAGWATLDTWPARRALLVEREGGEDDRPCRWAGCENRALRGREICVAHMYRRGRRA